MKPINTTLVEEIRKEKELPLVGVIGATTPTAPYTSQLGREVGYVLRQYFSTTNGTIFTGGVDGVGVDVYIGVMQCCMELARKSGQIQDDKFFVLIPSHAETLLAVDTPFLERSARRPIAVPYTPPSEYSALGYLTARRELDIVKAGNNMSERREYVSTVADALLVVNGGLGTLEEAIDALRHGKKLIPLTPSGGAAALIGKIKTGTTNIQLERELRRMSVREEELDQGLIHPILDSTGIASILKTIL